MLLGTAPPERSATDSKHEVVTVAYLNWTGMKNGELLKAAEDVGFEVMITSDHGVPYQQNMAGRKLALVMLSTADC